MRLSDGVRLRAVAAGAWIGEELCIRLYGAYQDVPGWTVFVDRVPLAIVLIWPAVVIATHAGLWSWNLPGAFGVPLIGPVGWACYAAAACGLLDGGEATPGAPAGAAPNRGAGAPGAEPAAALRRELAPATRTALFAPLLAHAGILAAWRRGTLQIRLNFSRAA